MKHIIDDDESAKRYAAIKADEDLVPGEDSDVLHMQGTLSLADNDNTPTANKSISKEKINELSTLVDSYLDTREKVKDENGYIKQFFYGSCFSFFQESYSAKKNAVDLLKMVLETLRYNEKTNVDLEPHLSTLRNGNLGKQLRAFIKQNGQELLGTDQPVKTIREFVKILTEKTLRTNQDQQP